MRQHVKLLLLGAGASGKSTVLKQMRLIHNVAFTPSEIEYYRQLVFVNVVQGMKLIIDAMDSWEMSASPENRVSWAAGDATVFLHLTHRPCRNTSPSSTTRPTSTKASHSQKNTFSRS